MKQKKHIIICGAGIAGVATAYYLLQRDARLKVTLIDKQQPLSFTTSKSGENFRDFWPHPAMTAFAGRSIELMRGLLDAHGKDTFRMTFSGYNFISKDPGKPIFSTTENTQTEGFVEALVTPADIQQNYPYLSDDVQRIVSIKNAGSIDVYAMGSLLLQEARKLGLQLVEGEINALQKKGSGIIVTLADGLEIRGERVVLAAGPFIADLASKLGIELPVQNILQQKFIIPDPAEVIPKSMPFTIYADGQLLDWSDEEAAFFKTEPNYRWLLKPFPGGLHIKPEPSGIKLGWAFNTTSEAPKWNPANSELFPQIVLKGAARFIPGLAIYEKDIPTPIVRYGGYYTRTPENWPLIGPTEVPGVFVVGALAGFGTMSACAAGELCSQYLLAAPDLPSYAQAFHPLRYQDPEMVEAMAQESSDRQL
jgi:glycine/D-amino acid oxidase-like deaminating enzyme